MTAPTSGPTGSAERCIASRGGIDPGWDYAPGRRSWMPARAEFNSGPELCVSMDVDLSSTKDGERS